MSRTRTAEFLAIYYDPKNPGCGTKQMLQYVDAFHQEIDAFPDMAVVGPGYSWLRQFFPYAAAAAVRTGKASLMTP